MNHSDLRRVFDDNYRLTQLFSRFLTYAPNAISWEMVKEMTKDGMESGEAYAYLLSALFDIDMEDRIQRKFFREYLLPSVKRLDPEIYRRDPYFASVRFPEKKLGKWELKTVTYPAYRGFVCGDPIVQDDHKELQQLGFFEEEYSFPAVLEDGNEWMTLTPVDMDTCQDAIKEAKGRVVTFGLGLGYYAFMVSEKETVEEVVVIERSEDVISLFKQVLLPQFPHKDKIRIISADAFVYAKEVMPKENFDYAFVDTWRDAGDGLEHYLKMKQYEHLSPGTVFSYWIEDTLLSRLRALVFEKAWEESKDSQTDMQPIEAMLQKETLCALAKTLYAADFDIT